MDYVEHEQTPNAQLSSPKRNYQLSAQHRNHQTQRKTKMPRVEGLLELFVRRLFSTCYKTCHLHYQQQNLTYHKDGKLD